MDFHPLEVIHLAGKLAIDNNFNVDRVAIEIPSIAWRN